MCSEVGKFLQLQGFASVAIEDKPILKDCQTFGSIYYYPADTVLAAIRKARIQARSPPPPPQKSVMVNSLRSSRPECFQAGRLLSLLTLEGNITHSNRKSIKAVTCLRGWEQTKLLRTKPGLSASELVSCAKEETTRFAPISWDLGFSAKYG